MFDYTGNDRKGRIDAWKCGYVEKKNAGLRYRERNGEKLRADASCRGRNPPTRETHGHRTTGTDIKCRANERRVILIQ